MGTPALLQVGAYAVLGWAVACAASAFLSPRISSTYAGLETYRKINWTAYVLSSVHTVFTLCVAVANLRIGEDLAADDPCTGQLDWRDACFVVTCAYFAVDLLLMLSAASAGEASVDAALIFHHVLTASGIGVAVRFSYVTWFLAALLFNEASTVFLNVRWFLLTVGMKRSPLYFYNGVLLVVVFFLCRVVLLPAVFYAYTVRFGLCWGADHVPAAVRAASAANFPVLWGVNLVWFAKLVRGAVKVLRSRGAEGAGGDTDGRDEKKQR